VRLDDRAAISGLLTVQIRHQAAVAARRFRALRRWRNTTKIDHGNAPYLITESETCNKAWAVRSRNPAESAAIPCLVGASGAEGDGRSGAKV